MADQDILIGPGRLLFAPLNTADPDETSVAFGASWGGSWVDLGEFLEGNPVTIGMNEEFVKVYTEQSTAPKGAARTRREAIIKVTLAEHSVANMGLVYDGTPATTPAGAGQKGFSEIPIGISAAVKFMKWGIEGARKDANGVDQPVRYIFDKGYLRLAGDLAFAKQNATGVPIEINVLGSGTTLGRLQIVTAAASS